VVEQRRKAANDRALVWRNELDLLQAASPKTLLAF
jgi:hypothetical protein